MLVPSWSKRLRGTPSTLDCTSHARRKLCRSSSVWFSLRSLGLWTSPGSSKVAKSLLAPRSSSTQKGTISSLAWVAPGLFSAPPLLSACAPARGAAPPRPASPREQRHRASRTPVDRTAGCEPGSEGWRNPTVRANKRPAGPTGPEFSAVADMGLGGLWQGKSYELSLAVSVGGASFG